MVIYINLCKKNHRKLCKNRCFWKVEVSIEVYLFLMSKINVLSYWGYSVRFSIFQSIIKTIMRSSRLYVYCWKVNVFSNSQNQVNAGIVIHVKLCLEETWTYEIFFYIKTSCLNTLSRGGSRSSATSKMERFVIIINGRKPLTIITKRSI